MSSTQYISYPVPLSDHQLKLINNALRYKKRVTIQINFQNPKQNLPLTQTQINKMKKEKSFRLTLSVAQLRQISKKDGGFLPLLALLGLAGTAAGAAAGITQAVQSKQANDAAITEQKRFNKAKLAQINALQKQINSPKKKGGFIGLPFLANEIIKLTKNLKGNQKVSAGKGLYLSKQGDGLYLGKN